MEKALRSRKFMLQEIAPVAFLNHLIPRNEWHVEVDGNGQVVTVNGDPSDDVRWNELLRTLVWTNSSAEDDNIMAGAISFNREFTACHGKVTSGRELSYLVGSVPEGEAAPDYLSAQNGILPIFGLDELDVGEPPPSYAALEATGIQNLDAQLDAKRLVVETPVDQADADFAVAVEAVEALDDNVHEDATFAVAAAAAPGEAAGAAAEAAPAEPLVTSKIKVLTYSTMKRQKTEAGDEDWEPFGSIGVGSEFTGMLHAVILFGNDEITQYVVMSQDGDHYVKQAQKAGDPCPWAFDITFTGSAEARTFSGTLVNAKGKEFEWKGQFSSLSEIARDGSNQRVKGSDGLFLDPLLHGITSLARTVEYDEKTKQARPVDLAQREADRTFGRLVFGSVDDEVAKLLFPGMFSLTPAEKGIQKLGSEFLKRAGIHSILANIKASDQVKAETKNKIKQDRCERFIPMCISAMAEPSDPANDPVVLYGLNREKDKALVAQLQGQAQAVSRACYLHGYRTAVVAMQPYLNNAGEWYAILEQTLTSSIFLQDWQNKTAGSEGFAKTLYDIHTKLDVLWQVAQEKPDFKDKLPQNVKPPTEVVSALNAAGLMAALDSIEFDDTARQNLKDFFRKLDDTEKDERTKKLGENFRKQMIVDQGKPQSFQTMGEYVVQLMDELRQGKRWSARETDAQLALFDAQRVRAGAGADAPAWYKDIPWKEGFMCYFRSAVTVVALGGLVYLFSQQGASMGWDDQLALFGQMAEGFASVRGVMAKFGQAGAGAAMGIGAFLNKWFLAPLGNLCKFVGTWLYNSLHQIGRSLIVGIGGLLAKIKAMIASKVEAVSAKVGQAGTWLKNLPIRWGAVFNALAKIASFGVSALCFWVALRDCINAWQNGRPIDKAMSTIGAALAGMEVLCLVIQGIAWLKGGTAVVSFFAGIGTVLAVAGIIFAVALIIVAFACQEDPLDDLVEKYGRMYGIVG